MRCDSVVSSAALGHLEQPECVSAVTEKLGSRSVDYRFLLMPDMLLIRITICFLNIA